MRVSILSVALASAVVASSATGAEAPAGQPFQVLRANDRQLTCEQLIGEHNELNAQAADAKAAEAKAAQAHQKKKVKRGIMGGVASGAIWGAANKAFIHTDNRVVANAAYHGGGAAATAIERGANSAAPAPAPAADAELKKQRLQRVNTLIAEKRC